MHAKPSEHMIDRRSARLCRLREINDLIIESENSFNDVWRRLAWIEVSSVDSTVDNAVDSAIQPNTREVCKDKWFCPLSGKKFKGPDFVLKHILNKHMERVEEVKKNVEYFNNYIFDPKRPQLPEHPSNRQPTTTPNRGDGTSGVSNVIPNYMPAGPTHFPVPPPYMGAAYGPREPPMSGFGGPMMGGYGPGRCETDSLQKKNQITRSERTKR